MIFVARYKDGTCGIADAQNETEARALLQSEAAWFNPDDDELVSLRLTLMMTNWFLCEHSLVHS